MSFQHGAPSVGLIMSFQHGAPSVGLGKVLCENVPESQVLYENASNG
jgi:hypothetical protein